MVRHIGIHLFDQDCSMARSIHELACIDGTLHFCMVLIVRIRRIKRHTVAP